MSSNTEFPTSVKGTFYVVLDKDCFGRPIVYMATYKPTESDGRVIIESFEVEREIPADFNPVAAQVNGLRNQLEALHSEYQKRRQQIESSINDLLCLEAPAEAA